LTVLAFRNGDAKILLRGLASLYIYQEADSGFGNSELSCLVLDARWDFSFFGRPFSGGFFMRLKLVNI